MAKPIQLDVYLFFNGRCRQAMEFYKTVFGGKLSLQTYGQMSGERPEPMKNISDDWIMHSRLTGGAVNLMASDSTRKEAFGESFISLSLGGSDEAQLRAIFDKLAEGGKVSSAIKKEFWGDLFGAVTDQFGVDWMVNIGSQ